MSIKRKLSMGAMSALLGMSLVGGGTWAAFNDTKTINNYFAAGTLELEIGKVNRAANFDLGNMKPGDEVKRVFTLNNVGSLAIKEVLLNTTADEFVGTAANENMVDFLEQFTIKVFSVDSENTEGKFEPRAGIIKNNQKLTLKDLVNGDYVGKIKPEYLAQAEGDYRINLAPLVGNQEGLRGLPADPRDSDSVMFVIKFENDLTRANEDNPYSSFVQNKYQGNSVQFFFNLEATQWDGMILDSSHGNGNINNAVQGSADGLNKPNPVTVPRGVDEQELLDEVVDGE